MLRDTEASLLPELLLKRLGWRSLLIQGDPLVFERWKWLRHRLRSEDRPHESTVLDAGCGNGCFSMWAAAIGHETLGLSDTGDDLRKATRRAELLGVPGARFEQFDLRDLATAGSQLGKFDAVLCLEVVEHVLDDVGLLRNLGDRLHPGGTLLITTPTHDHRPLFGERDHLSGVENGGHVRWGYSEEQLASVLREAGLEPKEFARFGGYLTQRACGALWRMSRFDLRLAWVCTFPLRIVTVIDGRLTEWLKLRYMSLGAVASKLPSASDRAA